MKDVASQKKVTITPEFHPGYGHLSPSESSSQFALYVQFDVEKAQTTEVDIEILVIIGHLPLYPCSPRARTAFGQTCTPI
jgi:hypothetical protein